MIGGQRNGWCSEAMNKPRAHSCFVKKYKMRAVQWENDFNTFLQTVVHISSFFGFFSNVGVYWWCLVVMAIGDFSST